jgi:hypothetical protein
VSYLILQSEYYSRLEDIHVAGLVIYVGTDDKARQASGIFGGSFIKDLVNEGQADLKRLIDHATTVIKYFFVIPLICQADLCPRYKLIDPTAPLPSFPQITAQTFNPELRCDDGEGVRDRNHRVAPLMMLDKLGEFCGDENLRWRSHTFQGQLTSHMKGKTSRGR